MRWSEAFRALFDWRTPRSMPDYADLPALRAWAAQIMSRKPDFVIGDDYLRRWWIVPRNRLCNVYLHLILHSDDDRALHDHPWANTSVIIAGSYVEHTPEGSFVRSAGDVIHREADALHRLEVTAGEPVVSLFITGPIVREWGFRCPQGWVHWRDFTNPEDTGKVGRGCGEHNALPADQKDERRLGNAHDDLKARVKGSRL